MSTYKSEEAYWAQELEKMRSRPNITYKNFKKLWIEQECSSDDMKILISTCKNWDQIFDIIGRATKKSILGRIAPFLTRNEVNIDYKIFFK